MTPAPASAPDPRTAAPATTVGGVLWELATNPYHHLVRRWNWKSAVTSAAMRAVLYLAVNLRYGWEAGLSAAATDIVLRLTTSGVYGSLIEAFRRVQPGWQAALATLVLLPAVSHVVEYVVHTLRGTADVKGSLIASVTFTVLSTLFNLYAMRKGVLIVGEGQQSLSDDLRRMPRIMASFLLVAPRALWRLVRR